MPGTGIVNTAETNVGSYGETASVRKKTWNSRIRDCEWIKRIRDWDTDIEGNKAYVSTWDLEWVGYKWNRRQGRVEK